jgi:hypothetical protein
MHFHNRTRLVGVSGAVAMVLVRVKEGSKYWSVGPEVTTGFEVVDDGAFSLELRSLPCVPVATESSCEYIEALVVCYMLISILNPEAVICRCFV